MGQRGGDQACHAGHAYGSPTRVIALISEVDTLDADDVSGANTMQFETERLRIRDPVATDLEGVHAFLSDPAVMRWTHLGPEPYTWAQSREWIEAQMDHNRAEPRFSHNSVIVERNSAQILGWIGIGAPADATWGDLDFGYALRRQSWGNGYMTEALRGVLLFAFEHMGATSVFGMCETANVGSARVMEKAGMQHIATCLERRFPLAEAVPMCVYQIARKPVTYRWAR
jgi:RimJ/RimL family protein N-acetyltransferase